jgi:hypothetical protein
MTDSLIAMSAPDEVIEQRIFEMLGERRDPQEIAAALGLTVEDAMPMILKVFDERGTPQLVEIDRSLDRLAAARAGI